MRESNWYGIDICSECENRLTDHEKMYSGGVCPKCGKDSKCTVCDTKKVVLKEIKHYKWWQIFDRKKTYRGRDEFSEKWENEY